MIERMESIRKEVESIVNQAVDRIYKDVSEAEPFARGKQVRDAFKWAAE